jgi:UDP-N-acetylmuramoylalanine--D-glutamate ligase
MAASTAYNIALLEGDATESLYKELVAADGYNKVIGRFDNLRRAVHALFDQAEAGDVVLLSPGCASFGMFPNEFHRGETFVNIFRELPE